MRGNDAVVRALGEPRLERAIGVVYLPETERHSHYFRSLLPAQFDAVLHGALGNRRGARDLSRGRLGERHTWSLVAPPIAFQAAWPPFMYFASKPASRSAMAVRHPT